MGLFDKLKSAIFGTQAQSAQSATQGRTSQAAAPPPAAAAKTGSPAANPAQTPSPAAATARAQPVDVEAVLDGMAKQKPQRLEWRSSIVDLMKLVDLDPSLENRKTLAGELGYSGDTHDSASMNIWLHKQVMQKLAEAGGTVPPSLH
jgi:hypothetical protein